MVMEKVKERMRRITSALLCVLLAAVTVLGCIFGVQHGEIEVSAAEIQTGGNAFDGTSVNEDLQGLDLSGYTFNATLDPQVIYFMEYCYGEDVIDCVNYGLYVYVYNPAKLTFSDRAGANTLNMAVEYNAEGKPDGYANVPLRICGQSTGTLEGLIWKFRVMDEGNEILSNARALERQTGERRYDVAGIQLWTAGEANGESYDIIPLPEDYVFAMTYFYSGYSKGFSDSSMEESTLDFRTEDLTTVPLDLRHGFYCPEGTNGDDYTQDSLASVYFAVPNDLIEEYGELYAVHFTFLEAVTDWMFVTGNSDVYNELLGYAGQDITGKDLQYGFGAGREENRVDAGLWEVVFEYGYNQILTGFGTNAYISRTDLTNLKYIFPVDGGMDETDSADDYVLQWEVIQEYMEQYSAGKSDLIFGRYAPELFSWVADEVTDKELSAEDEFHLTGITFDNWWNEIWGIETETPYTMPAIQEVTSCQSAAQVEAAYYLDESCYDDFKEYYDANSNDGTVYVFHFAQSEYYAMEAYNLDNDVTGLFDSYEMDSNARLLKETVYLNFDIIDVSMKKGETITVLGVVANPIDVIPNGTPAVETTSDAWRDWAEEFMKLVLSILGIIGGIAIIALLWGPITTLLGLLLKLICMPFKAISKAVKNRKDKKK